MSFGKVRINQLRSRVDSRGFMSSDPQIGLRLPMPVSEISDYDQNAPFVF